MAMYLHDQERMIDGPEHKLAGVREGDGAYATACGLMLPANDDKRSSEGAWPYDFVAEPLCGDCFTQEEVRP
jgi:hypothetical protein